jgi:hypothetical protein
MGAAYTPAAGAAEGDCGNTVAAVREPREFPFRYIRLSA